MEQILGELQALNVNVEKIAGYLQPRSLSIDELKDLCLK